MTAASSATLRKRPRRPSQYSSRPYQYGSAIRRPCGELRLRRMEPVRCRIGRCGHGCLHHAQLAVDLQAWQGQLVAQGRARPSRGARRSHRNGGAPPDGPSSAARPAHPMEREQARSKLAAMALSSSLRMAAVAGTSCQSSRRCRHSAVGRSCPDAGWAWLPAGWPSRIDGVGVIASRCSMPVSVAQREDQAGGMRHAGECRQGGEDGIVVQVTREAKPEPSSLIGSRFGLLPLLGACLLQPDVLDERPSELVPIRVGRGARHEQRLVEPLFGWFSLSRHGRDSFHSLLLPMGHAALSDSQHKNVTHYCLIFG